MKIKTMLRVLKSGKALKFDKNQLKMLDHCEDYIKDKEVLDLLTDPSLSPHKMRILLKAYNRGLTLADLKYLVPLEENKMSALKDTMCIIGDRDIINRLRDENFSSAAIFEINTAFTTLPKEKLMLLLNPDYSVKKIVTLQNIYMANLGKEIENYLIKISDEKGINIKYYINLFKYGFNIEEVEYIKSLNLNDKYISLLGSDYYKGLISKENILSLNKDHLIILLEEIEDNKRNLNDIDTFKDNSVDLDELKRSLQNEKGRSR